MRTSLLLLLLSSLFLSCSKYQYLTISSDTAPLNSTNDFVTENDTVKIVYRFFGFNAPVQLSVFNKTSRGLQIDWSKSFLIRGSSPVPLHNPVNTISGEAGRTGEYSNTKNFSATVTAASSLEFIPPQAAVSRSCIEAVSKNAVNIDQYEMVKQKIRIGNFSKKIKKAGLQKENTPLSFRIYLTILTGGKDSETMTFDHSFYVSELMVTKTDPNTIFWQNKDGNVATLEKSTTGGTLLTMTGMAAVIAAVAIAAGNDAGNE